MIENRAGKWCVLSHDGAVLSEHPTEAEAQTADAGAPRADVLRLDASAATRTDEGFLRVPARITRTGIMEYHRGGRVVRELRRPDEVFRADSTATLAGRPITIGHAVPIVTARDTREHAVGYVESDVVQADGRYLDATLMVWRADAVAAIESHELTELSAGYRTRSGPGGTWRGQAYDIEQTDIRYNHVALLPPGHARGGSELSIRLDSHDLITLLRDRLDALALPDADLAVRLGLPDADGVRLLLDGDMGLPNEALLTRAANLIHVPVAELLTLAAPPPKPPRRIPSMKRQITINGITFEVELPDQMAGAFDGAVTAERAAADQVRTDAAETATKLAEAEAERDKLKTERDALQARCDAADLERVREQAQAVYADAKGETVREIQVSVLTHLEHEIRADASDAEIAGAFAFAVKHATKGKPEGKRSAGASAKPDERTDAADEHSAEAARKRMLARNQNAWRPEKSA